MTSKILPRAAVLMLLMGTSAAHAVVDADAGTVGKATPVEAASPEASGPVAVSDPAPTPVPNESQIDLLEATGPVARPSEFTTVVDVYDHGAVPLPVELQSGAAMGVRTTVIREAKVDAALIKSVAIVHKPSFFSSPSQQASAGWPVYTTGGAMLLLAAGVLAMGPLGRRRDEMLEAERPSEGVIPLTAVDVFTAPPSPFISDGDSMSHGSRPMFQQPAFQPRRPAQATAPAPRFVPPAEPTPEPVAMAWTTYKFFRLNSGGIIDLAGEGAHSGDEAAVSHARSFGRGQMVEVWSHRRMVATVS